MNWRFLVKTHIIIDFTDKGGEMRGRAKILFEELLKERELAELAGVMCKDFLSKQMEAYLDMFALTFLLHSAVTSNLDKKRMRKTLDKTFAFCKRVTLWRRGRNYKTLKNLSHIWRGRHRLGL